MTLTFAALRAANLARQRACPDYDWSLTDWIIATGGEVGEVLNVVKKLTRADDGLPGNARLPSELIADLADELADAVIYLDLALARAGDPALVDSPLLGDTLGWSRLSGFDTLRDTTLWDWREAAAVVRQVASSLLLPLGRLAEEGGDEENAIADLLTGLDCLAFAAGIDLGAAVVSKFNRSSEKLGYDVKLEAA